ncbi:hypothetical protein evm_007736 [Chilo suppressalis]|nr:hypothetical protein evm_007736 [Chilo suppressalis]
METQKKVVAIVSDNVANIVAAIREGGWRQIGCFAHSINLAVQIDLKLKQDLVTLILPRTGDHSTTYFLDSTPDLNPEDDLGDEVGPADSPYSLCNNLVRALYHPEVHREVRDHRPQDDLYLVHHWELHILMVNLPQYFITAQRLINATWPTSLLNIRNSDGMTALHLAVINNQPGMVRYLLVAGADPMCKDNWGRVPLHFACKKNIDMITALTKAFKLWERAKMQSKKLIIRDLSKSIDMRDHNGETPLFIATENGHLNIVNQLVNLGATIHAMRYGDGRLPLYVAISKGYKHITKYILNYYYENPDKNIQFEYCYPVLMTSLRQMGLDKAFIKILRIPVERLYSQHSSDSSNLGTPPLIQLFNTTSPGQFLVFTTLAFGSGLD